MCNAFCKEFRGWCRSFTKTEVLLAILELLLLILLVALIVFLVLHLIACAKKHERDSSFIKPTRAYKPRTTKSITMKTYSMSVNIKTTPVIACTWKPSNKTPASNHYYENEEPTTPMTPQMTRDVDPILTTNKSDEVYKAQTFLPVDSDDSAWYSSDESDGEEPEEMYKSFILALVKLRPSGDVTFGCILSAVSEHWALTAVSCIEAIEEVDSLDSFVMLERYGEGGAGAGVGPGRAHDVVDVRAHPQYGAGARRDRDVAALRAGGRLLRGARPPRLPAPLDVIVITLGERLTLLGFGPFRSIAVSASGRGLRRAAVYSLPAGQCAARGEGEGQWAPRHLWAGRAVGRGAAAGGGARPLCAGVLRARGTACNYCAGAALLRGDTLLALQAAAGQCGAACEPQLYTNLAAIRDWLQYVIRT